MTFNRVYESLKRKFDNSEKQSPLQFKYTIRLCFMLSTIGCWPHRQFGRQRLDAVLTIYNKIVSYSGWLLTCSCGAYLWYYCKHTSNITVYDIAHIILTTLFGCFCWTRMMIARTDKYRETVKIWLHEFHLFYFKSRSQYSTKIFSQIHIISTIFSYYVQFVMWNGIVLFNLQPWYNNYSEGMFRDNRPANTTFEHAVYYYFGTETPYTTVNGYWMLFTLNLYISYNVACGLFVFDLLLSLIVFQIWGHLKILKHNLNSIALPEARDGMYSSKENIRNRDVLKENILHHNLITKFVNKCSVSFSEYLLVLYTLLQIITCILLLEISPLTLEAFARYGALTVGMYQQLIQVSVLFEMINTKSEQLIDAVYGVPWECMDTRNRKTVLLLLRRVQSPLSLKAGKVVPVGVKTMSAILKTTFTYYMMLITLAREK